MFKLQQRHLDPANDAVCSTHRIKKCLLSHLYGDAAYQVRSEKKKEITLFLDAVQDVNYVLFHLDMCRAMLVQLHTTAGFGILADLPGVRVNHPTRACLMSCISKLEDILLRQGTWKTVEGLRAMLMELEEILQIQTKYNVYKFYQIEANRGWSFADDHAHGPRLWHNRPLLCPHTHTQPDELDEGADKAVDRPDMFPKDSTMDLTNYSFITDVDRFWTPQPAWSAGSRIAGIPFEVCAAFGINPAHFPDLTDLVEKAEMTGKSAVPNKRPREEPANESLSADGA